MERDWRNLTKELLNTRLKSSKEVNERKYRSRLAQM